MRLSSDATAVQEMVGTRLAVVCEGFALSFFGLLFGCLLNWQLTLIVFGPMIILVAANIVEIEVCKWQDNLNGAIFGQASTVRTKTKNEKHLLRKKILTMINYINGM